MDYASPAPGIYVFNDILVDSGVEIPYPLLAVSDGHLYVAQPDSNHYWRFDKDNDVIVSADNDGVDNYFITDSAQERYEIELEPDDRKIVAAVTKSSVTGRIG